MELRDAPRIILPCGYSLKGTTDIMNQGQQSTVRFTVTSFDDRNGAWSHRGGAPMATPCLLHINGQVILCLHLGRNRWVYVMTLDAIPIVWNICLWIILSMVCTLWTWWQALFELRFPQTGEWRVCEWLALVVPWYACVRTVRAALIACVKFMRDLHEFETCCNLIFLHETLGNTV